MKYVYILITIFVVIRTVSYAIWCKNNKNIFGAAGVFILVLMLIYEIGHLISE